MNRSVVSTEFTYQGEKISIEGYSNKDLIFKNIASEKKFYEQRLLNEIKSLNLRGSYVDVGSNIGNHSIFFNRFCPSDFVFCFEISEKICDILRANMKKNCSKNYSVVNIGILNFKGYVDISEINNENTGLTKIINNNGTSHVVDKLDNLLRNEENISLIKFDIEGFELEALLGATEILRKHSPVIIAELPTSLEFDRFNHYLSKFNYVTNGKNYAITPTYIFLKK